MKRIFEGQTQVVQAPVDPTDAANKNYVDTKSADSELFDTFAAETTRVLSGYGHRLDHLMPELITVTLANSSAYPNNNSGADIALAVNRPKLNYFCSYEIQSVTGGFADGVSFSNKLANGFHAAFTGSAVSVTLTIKVEGGIWKW
jgi:hypothetical protein